MNGDLGRGDAAWEFRNDSTFTGSGSGLYCAVTGAWSIEGDQLSATGADCDGTMVTLQARGDATRMSGDWSASPSGNRGTFEMTKDEQ